MPFRPFRHRVGRLTFLLVVGVLSSMTAGLSSNGSEIELARDGKTEYAIIRNTSATAAEVFATQELSAFLEKVTGAKFVIISERTQPLPQKAIYVGQTDLAARHVDFSKLGQEDWIIKTADQNLILAGGRPRGTLYAVYEFLEQKLGCHWLDEFTEVVPSRPELKLATMNIKGRPAFWDRAIFTSSDNLIDEERMSLFNARNKDTGATSAQYGFGNRVGSPSHCHTFYLYSKDWPTNHPEYLAMNANGERLPSTSGLGPGQICLTHPEVRKLMLEKLRRYIATDRETAAKAGYPPPRIYVIASNDNPIICQCPECKAIVEREGANVGATIDLANFLADGVKDEFPDVLVQTFAYLQTVVPPKTIRPRDNVIIQLAQLNVEWTGGAWPKNELDEYPDFFRPMTNAINRKCSETLVNWSKITKHLSIWDYWVIYDFNGTNRFMTPYVNLVCIKSDLELFFNNHVEMIYAECEKPEDTSFFALKHWLGLKLMQDPRQPDEPLVQTFMSGYYGPASAKMNAYLAYMEQRISHVPETDKLSGMLERDRPYLDLDFYITSTKLLDEAALLCNKNKAALLHVQREMIPVDSGLLGMWEHLEKKLPAGKTMPFDRDAVLKHYETARLAQIEAFYAKEKQADGKKRLAKQLQEYKGSP